jgi:ankyrin repeat protein
LAQYSNTYTFFQGIRDRDFAAVEQAVEAPGSTVINARDRDTGDGAIHIVTRRRDTQYLLYLLRARANPNLRNRNGETAMHIAAQIGYLDGVHWLNVVEADVNATNGRGETPLVLAVQQRNEDIVRQLVEAGADPDIRDNVIGMSARDYAERDTRGAAILALLDQAQPAELQDEQIGPSPN